MRLSSLGLSCVKAGHCCGPGFLAQRCHWAGRGAHRGAVLTGRSPGRPPPAVTAESPPEGPDTPKAGRSATTAPLKATDASQCFCRASPRWQERKQLGKRPREWNRKTDKKIKHLDNLQPACESRKTFSSQPRTPESRCLCLPTLTREL